MNLPARLRSLLAPFLLLAAVHPAGGATPHDERDAVMDITQQACEAFRVGNLAAAERLLAPTFTLVGSDATIQDRRAVIAEIRSREPRYEVFRNHSMTAHLYGTAAVVQGVTHVKGTSSGQAFDVEVRFTDTLIKTNGQWQLVVSHVTRIPAPPKR